MHYADRSLGIGYTGRATILLIMLLLVLAIWHRLLGSVSISSINSAGAEMF